MNKNALLKVWGQLTPKQLVDLYKKNKYIEYVDVFDSMAWSNSIFLR